MISALKPRKRSRASSDNPEKTPEIADASSKGSRSSLPNDKADDEACDEVCPVEGAVLNALDKWVVPDGRKCRLCWRHDNEDDEVCKALGKKRVMYWGYDPRPKSYVTSGYHCGYCTKDRVSK